MEQAHAHLNESFDSEELYNAILDADTWDDRGYELQNSYKHEETQDIDGVQMDAQTGEGDHYHAQFAELQEEGLWIHIDVPVGTTDKLEYMITMGDQETVKHDLASAINDAQAYLSD